MFRKLQVTFLGLTRAAVLGLLVLALAACATATPTPAPTAQPAEEEPAEAPAATEAAEPEPTEPAGEPALSGEISFLIWQNSPGMDKAVGEDLPRAFEAKYPGTAVNVTVLPWGEYDTKLALLVSAGTPPDIFECGTDCGRYVQEGVVVPLDELIMGDAVLGDPELSRVDANEFMRVDGEHLYGTQFGAICGMQLYYNMDLFDAAGVEYPNADWTWDDFLAAAQELTVQDDAGEIVQWGTTWGYLGGWDGGWAPLVWDNGGQIYDVPFFPNEFYFDSPEVVEAWAYMQDLIYTHEVAPRPAAMEVLDAAGGPFLSGKVAMLVDGCWMMTPYKNADFQMGMTVLPQGSEGRINTGWFAGGMTIAAASENKDLAWEYLRWLAVDEEANEILATIGQSCGAPMVRAYDEVYAQAWADIPGGDACTDSLENTRAASIWHPNWARIWGDLISPEWERFVNGEISAQELSDAIAGPANDMLLEE